VEAYPIDFEPEHLARWFIAERQAAVPKFELLTNCSKRREDLPLRKELRIGDEVHSVVTIASLRITPIQQDDGWSASVAIEDDLGPQVSEED
jgi:hypothetical protein